MGLRCDGFIGVDIDILDPDYAELVEHTAKDTLGWAPVRTGLVPKRLLLYRVAEPNGELATGPERRREAVRQYGRTPPKPSPLTSRSLSANASDKLLVRKAVSRGVSPDAPPLAAIRRRLLKNSSCRRL